MKPLTSALLGAAMISGSWVVVPAVAFAEERATVAPSVVGEVTAAGTANDPGVACSADTHAHGSSCTCAHCAAAQSK